MIVQNITANSIWISLNMFIFYFSSLALQIPSTLMYKDFPFLCVPFQSLCINEIQSSIVLHEMGNTAWNSTPLTSLRDVHVQLSFVIDT